MDDSKERIEKAVADFARELAPGKPVTVLLERPRNPDHGDYAITVALQLAKATGRKPRDIAQEFIDTRGRDLLQSNACESLDMAGAGFINVRLKASSKTQIVRQVLEAGAAFGRRKPEQVQRVQVEFVSANPTGPLHVGHGRQAALGDALAALLESQGHEVTREFYYNDAGAQIQNLALSVQASASPSAACLPWPTCSGPVGLAETNSTCTFSAFPGVPRPKATPASRICRTMRVFEDALRRTLMKPAPAMSSDSQALL